MWIGDIDVPQAVLDAAADDELVLFIGAGASRDKPSGLPGFGDLVRKIGSLAHQNPNDDELRRPEVFLGRLADRGVEVNHLVAREIGRPTSQPNALHKAIVRLAASMPTPRIVTTNYDLHLTSAAASQGLALPVYRAPALPVGDDFEGIVHLHGSLEQDSRRLVVTDTDFGHAYLREAWAARFLERMFPAFTVLFIGYSHGDVVMQYLARALRPDDSRYVLSDEPDHPAWRSLGLQPIAYPNDAGDHAALLASVVRWATLAEMGHFAHRGRIADLVSGEPPTIPEEVSYLESVLSHPERIKHFVEKANFADAERSRRWFEWMVGRPAFPQRFASHPIGNESGRILMQWIADHYLACEDQSRIALSVFSDKPWPPDTWSVIARFLAARPGQFPRWLGPWLLLALEHAPSRQSRVLDMLLVGKDWSAVVPLALSVFADRTRPVLQPAPGFGTADGGPRFEVVLRGDEYWLTRSWAEVLAPLMGQHLQELLALITEQIASVYRSLRGAGSDLSFDPVSFARSAIEPHEQDKHREAIDVLIDAGRDCIEAAFAADPDLGGRYLSAWSLSSDTILRRLAVHGWRIRSDRTPDDKLRWLREQGWLWAAELKHEVFLLLRDAFPFAAAEIARWFVEAAAAGRPGSPARPVSPYESYNLLGWLAAAAPDMTVAAEAFSAAQSEHPEYRPREHPDLDHYTWSGVVEHAAPFTAAELHGLVSGDPAGALARLREFPSDRFAVEGPTWTGALRSLTACVAEYPQDGALLDRFLTGDDSDIRVAIIDGWGRANLEEERIEQALTIMAGWDVAEIRRPASDLLSSGGTPEHPTAWHRYPLARMLAAALWPTSEATTQPVAGVDMLFEAINDPAGDLAQFWVKAVEWDWSQDEASWTGIGGPALAALDRMVASAGRSGLLARTFLASQLHFLFAADQHWCERRLLPLFDWTADAEQAAAAWQGFLTWGRWNDGLLQAGLLEAYLMTAARAEVLPQALQDQLAGHLAAIALHASADPSTWLARCVVDAPDGLRVAWANRVHALLDRLEPGEEARQWDRWMYAYWTGRNQSTPLPFTADEAAATACWVFGLPSMRAQAVALVLDSPAGLDEQARFLISLEDEPSVVSEAGAWARLLTHLLANTSQPPWGLAGRLQGIVAALRGADVPPDLTGLIEEAMRLGVAGAAEWYESLRDRPAGARNPRRPPMPSIWPSPHGHTPPTGDGAAIGEPMGAGCRPNAETGSSLARKRS